MLEKNITSNKQSNLPPKNHPKENPTRNPWRNPAILISHLKNKNRDTVLVVQKNGPFYPTKNNSTKPTGET